MSRQVYTYSDLTKLKTNKLFLELIEYPQITVSTDLRKALVGNLSVDRVNGLFQDNVSLKVVDFHSFAATIEGTLNSDHSKFNEMIILSEFMRKKLEDSASDKKRHNWLLGCWRNLDSILSAIIMLEQAQVEPRHMNVDGDRNLELFVEAWNTLIDNELSPIKEFRKKMDSLTSKEAWLDVFGRAFGIDLTEKNNTVVLHGFYYFTPFQARIIRLMECAGIKLIFLIPYDDRYPFVYEIWDETYSVNKGFAPKSEWHIDHSTEEDPYGEIFEGRTAKISNNLVLKEYGSIMEFVDDAKRIKEKGVAIYSADFKTTNQLLKDYFPEVYGDRKILSYPIGQFIGTLNKMWDEEKQTIVIEEDNLIECFASGWLSVDGVSGKRYMQDLMYILPFFRGCHTIEQWEKRIEMFKEIEQSVIAPFEKELDPDIAVSRWQEAIGSPLKNFSMFSVESSKLDIILRLIKQLLGMAHDLFKDNSMIRVHDYIYTLNNVLRKHDVSWELYEEETELVKGIFEVLSDDNSFDGMCHPADIARALELFICGKYEEGEIQTNRVGMVYPLYFIDAACVKNQGNVHICMSDVDSLPGGNKDYIWPLTGSKIRETYETTKNPLILNLIQVMESTATCNRYFTYCGLKNINVTISWISTIGEKLTAPSPYIKLLSKNASVKIELPSRYAVTYDRVMELQDGKSRIVEYDNSKTPIGIIKEAKMDYALCPMKYVLGYVVEKYPTFQTEFHMTYALNGFISAIYSLMHEQGMKVDEIYDAVVSLFPNMRKVEKRQVYDYISYDRGENDLVYGNRTECGGRFYTDERLKIHYPNQEVRSVASAQFGKLTTPDGRKGMDLYETRDKESYACMFCQHVNYCRNALYSSDQESYYD